jgi:hypothetical protein
MVKLGLDILRDVVRSNGLEYHRGDFFRFVLSELLMRKWQIAT